MSQQREKYEVEFEGVKVEVQRLKDELFARKWDQVAAESQLAAMQKQL